MKKALFGTYFDWADFQRLKRRATKRDQDIFELIISRNKEKILIPYTDFHLSDLYNTDPKYLREDLNFINEITGGYHLRFEGTQNRFQFDSIDPFKRFSIIKSARTLLKDKTHFKSLITKEAITNTRAQIENYCEEKLNINRSQIIPTLRTLAKTHDFTRNFFRKTLEFGELNHCLHDAIDY